MDTQQTQFQGYNILDLWYKYEKIAMHFNELILKIRIQSLGAAALITTVASIMAKGTEGSSFNWEITASVLFLLMIFWVAIWLLDFKYYNRLLDGAVCAILYLEDASKNHQQYIHEINLSTFIDDAVHKSKKIYDKDRKPPAFGRRYFYLIVFLALFSGVVYSIYRYQFYQQPVTYINAL